MIINQAALVGIGRSFSTLFNQALEAAPSQWPLVAMRAPSGARSMDYKWLMDFGGMKEWIGDRVIKDLAGAHYEIVNKSWEDTIEVDRDDIEDDQIGVYSPRIQMMGLVPQEHRDLLVFQLLAAGFSTVCSDGQYFFDDDHQVNGASISNDGGGAGEPWILADLSRPIKPVILQIRKEPEFVAQDQPTAENVFMRKKFRYGVDDRKNVGFGLWQLAYGSKDTLTAAHYLTARASLIGRTKDDGVTPLNIRPTHLIVGPTNESAGRTVIEAEHDATGASNIWYHTAQLVVVPWLRAA